MERKWNDTWPDGTLIVPAAGMLVAHEWGEGVQWGVIEGVVSPTRYVLLGDCGLIDTTAGLDSPLAPAPSPGGLWAALLCLPGFEDDPEYGVARMDMELGYLLFDSTTPTIPQYVSFNRAMDAAQLPADTRDKQHYTTLLAYCAQPGWEVQRG
jgi:hypothetical protein